MILNFENENWNKLRLKLSEKYPQLTEADLQYSIGAENSLLRMVEYILMLNKNRKIINNLPFIRKIFFNDKERLFAFSLPLNERFSNTKAN